MAIKMYQMTPTERIWLGYWFCIGNGVTVCGSLEKCFNSVRIRLIAIG